MILESWYKSEKWLHLTDEDIDDFHCSKTENELTVENGYDFYSIIKMKGCFMMYALHKFKETLVVSSKQDTDMAIISFQMGGNILVNERNFEPYRHFENDLHLTFYSTKRELVFEAPPVFENFRIFIAPENFLTLLAKFHGRFSTYAGKVNRSESFNLFETPLPITPKMKLIIRELMSHEISDMLLSKVYFETKITELFGCQLEQINSIKNEDGNAVLTSADKEKIKQACHFLLQNLSDPPTINRLSRLVAINENKLKKGFKVLYGKSVFNYLLFYRIEKSTEMMKDEKMSLDEIGEKVGYGDGAHFSRAFRKVKGIPPGQFRKSLNGR